MAPPPTASKHVDGLAVRNSQEEPRPHQQQQQQSHQYVGTTSRRVTVNRNLLCKRLREKLYSVVGVSWPYAYDSERDLFHLLSDKSLCSYGHLDVKPLALSLGPCLDVDSRSPVYDNVPTVIRRFTKKTSQGKVVLGKVNDNGAELVVICKANSITDGQKSWWIGDTKEHQLQTSTGVHRLIAKAYMDGLCSMFFSRLVEKNLSPHFPLCYATSVNRVKFKRTSPPPRATGSAPSASPSTLGQTRDGSTLHATTLHGNNKSASATHATSAKRKPQDHPHPQQHYHDRGHQKGSADEDDDQAENNGQQQATTTGRLLQTKRARTSPDTSSSSSSSSSSATSSPCCTTGSSTTHAESVDIVASTGATNRGAQSVNPPMHGTTTGGTLCQVIWMEYLPQSMYEVLRKAKEASVWWSAIFQATAALTIAKRKCGFIHNDYHSENVRVYFVARDTVLYYRTDDDVCLAVPTFGNLFVTIDFGRAFVKPWTDKPGLLSSVFGRNGECSSVSEFSDNPSIDMIRLLGSLEDVVSVISDKESRQLVRDFCRRICRTDHGEDYLDMLSQARGGRLQYLLEMYPRKHCHGAVPEKIIPMFYNLYRVDACPPGVSPFPLPIQQTD